MGFLDGWKLGEDIDRNRERSAWEQEKQAQERAQWERETKARTESGRLMDEALGQRRDPATLDNTWLEQYGLTPQVQRPPVEQSAYGMRQGLAPAQSAPPMEGRVESPMPQAPRAPAPVNPMRQRALTTMQMAKANGDYNGFLAAQKMLDDADGGGKIAQLHSAVMGAPPDKITAFAKTYSDNSTAPGKLTTGKNGLMTLTLDGGEAIQMNRTQVAQYITGLYKMQQGDQTGLADIIGVSDKLAAATKDMWGKMKDVGSSNNDAVLKSNQMRNDNTRTGNSTASLGLQRENARMGQVRQYQDPTTGEIKEMYPVTTKGGKVTWEEVPTPAGMKPYVLRKAGDGAFKESPEAGSIGTVNGQRVQVQADGSYGAPGAETDPVAFVTAKYPDLVQSYPGQFSVTPDGKGLYIGTREDFVRMGGRVTAFDYKNPRDMQELEASLRMQAAGDRQAGEFAQELATRGGTVPSGRASAQGLRPQVDRSVGPRLTGQRAPEAPSIYASEQEWANYRKYQADKKQTNPR